MDETIRDRVDRIEAEWESLQRLSKDVLDRMNDVVCQDEEYRAYLDWHGERWGWQYRNLALREYYELREFILRQIHEVIDENTTGGDSLEGGSGVQG